MPMEKNNDPQVIMGGRYRLDRLLGRGNFAKVYKAHNAVTGEAVAIKVFDKDAVRRSGTVERVTREVDVMRRVHHPHVVRLHEVMATRSKIYLAMEYASGGELLERLARGTRFPEPVARRYFQQLITAIGFCHRRGVYHRDLKPQNLLLDACGDLKVSDFGLSALENGGGARLRGDRLLHTACGTPAYVAPEVLLKRGYNGAKADIWSCGVILFVLLAGFLPFNGINLACLYRMIKESNYRCPPWFSVEARKLLARMLDPNPNTRITISKIKANPWFQKCPCLLMETSLVKSKTVVLFGKEACKEHHRRDEEEDEEDDRRKRTKRSKVTITVTPSSMNAFDIITRSSGLDLSKMFDADHRSEVRFSTRETTSAILSKLEEIAEARKFTVTLKEKGRVAMEASAQDRLAGALSIEAEIFEVVPSVRIVELRKTGGDSIEFQNFYNQDLKPAMGDIV